MTEVVCTIGHSNRTIEEFIGLLKQNGIDCVLDIRTVPKSRHNPQFGQDQLPASLAAAGIGYRYFSGLGGLRHPRKDSPNGAWRNTSFRGYADYMQTEEFGENVDAVAALAQDTRCALMCAEAVPWRCHRSMVGDAAAGARHRGRGHHRPAKAQAAQAHALRPGRRLAHHLPAGTRVGLTPASPGEWRAPAPAASASPVCPARSGRNRSPGTAGPGTLPSPHAPGPPWSAALCRSAGSAG